MAALSDRLLLFFKMTKEVHKSLVHMLAIVTVLTNDMKLQEKNRDIEVLVHDLPDVQDDTR